MGSSCLGLKSGFHETIVWFVAVADADDAVVHVAAVDAVVLPFIRSCIDASTEHSNGPRRIPPGALRALCPVSLGVTPGIRPYARCHTQSIHSGTPKDRCLLRPI